MAGRGHNSAFVSSELSSKTSDSSVRVRRSGNQATITVKGPRDGPRETSSNTVPSRCRTPTITPRNPGVTPIIEKVRHWVEHAGMT